MLFVQKSSLFLGLLSARLRRFALLILYGGARLWRQAPVLQLTFAQPAADPSDAGRPAARRLQTSSTLGVARTFARVTLGCLLGPLLPNHKEPNESAGDENDNDNNNDNNNNSRPEIESTPYSN